MKLTREMFRKTPVLAALTSGYAWDGRNLCRLSLFDVPEWTLVCLTSLRTKYPPMLPKLDPKRAHFVLSKIDEILAWEKRQDSERETRFVELGRYMCEVCAGQYWRLEKLECFDEFLEKRFPESRRKAYYLMSIHEHLPNQARKQLKEVGWTKATELAKLARAEGQRFDCATWMHKARTMPKEEFRVRLRRNSQAVKPSHTRSSTSRSTRAKLR